MLRITRTTLNGTPALRLEGKLVGPWVAELRDACEWAPGQAGWVPPPLDLANVSFVDPAGAHLLEFLLRRGASLAAASNFVTELLYGLAPAKPGAQ